MCVPKEPHFFSFGGYPFEPVKVRNSVHSMKKVDSWEGYLSLFEKVPEEAIAIGEASASYIYAEKAPALIKEKIPDVKLIAILRNPVDRAFSNFTRCVRDGCEITLDFQKALKLEDERMRSDWYPKWFYKTKGYYYQQLKRYYELFDQDQIMICLYDDLTSRQSELIRELFSFLGVDEEFQPDVSQRHNQSRLVKNQQIDQLVRKRSRLKDIARSLVSSQVLSFASTLAKRMNSRELQMREETRRHLLNEYREDISKLEGLINRDLSIWLEK